MEKINLYAFADEASPMMDRQIAAMLRNHLAGLEIRNVDGENVSDITLAKAREVKEKLEAGGLKVWSVGSPLGKIDIEQDDFAAHLEKVRHTCEIANVLGTQNIRIFSFYIPQEKEAALYKNEVIDRLGKMCEIAGNQGVILCHENEKGIYGDIPARCLELFQALPKLRGIFDPANFIQCGCDTLEGWKLLKEHIFYMHIKDALADGTVVPAGEGIGNVGQIVRAYRELGGSYFTVEPHLMEFVGLKALEREGEESGILNRCFADEDAAFDAACDAFKKLL